MMKNRDAKTSSIPYVVTAEVAETVEMMDRMEMCMCSMCSFCGANFPVCFPFCQQIAG